MPSAAITLSPEAKAICESLQSKIDVRISQAGGTLRFSQFMQIALYEPGLGYYQNHLHKFGEQGDFVTAPEISAMFGRCIAQSLQGLDYAKDILELGAGSGTLAESLLLSMAEQDNLPESYSILEPSAPLQLLQQEKLEQHQALKSTEKRWLTRMPEEFAGLILANEVLDALPCERITKTEQGWQYLGVARSGDGYIWKPAGEVAASDLPTVLDRDENYLTGYTTEICPLANQWIATLAKSLNRGCLLLFDYGYPENEYYHHQRTDGSLRCFSRHTAHQSALQLAGLQDITAHVNFTAIARAAVDAGLQVSGFTTQAGFLLENGLLENLARYSDHNESSAAGRFNPAMLQDSQQIQKLVAPGQMGELVKVLALTTVESDCPAGFSLQDQLPRL